LDVAEWEILVKLPWKTDPPEVAYKAAENAGKAGLPCVEVGKPRCPPVSYNKIMVLIWFLRYPNYHC
jgi:hypothetical protein